MEQNKIHSLSLNYILELIIQAEEALYGARELLVHLSEKDAYKKNEYVYSLACELVWLNYSTLTLINRELETATLLSDTEKDGKEIELVITKETLQILQSMLVSNYYANNELGRTPYSVAFH